ncbi:MAG TPA: Rieske 2Fe-2S domain-containing protein [Puia sp.]|jgi:3-phenylpropionate/trans-cinnamate dioxygenase ferredoxin subunit
MGTKKYKWHKVAEAAADLQWTAGNVAEVEVEGKKLCVARSGADGAGGGSGTGGAGEKWFGIAHTCPHAGAPMTDGYVAGGCNIVCPVHNLKFNLKNGRDVNGEGYTLKTYPVEAREDGVYFGVEDGGGFFKKWF